MDLSNLRMVGGRPDGSVYPGADLDFIVDFDQVAAGCTSSSGFCAPGADITWYVDNQYSNGVVGSGYNEAYGYAVTFGMNAPTSPGVYTVTVESKNSLTFTYTVVGQGSEPGAGSVRIPLVRCGNGPDFNCSCEANGQLIIYFERTVISAGQGVAYVEALIDGIPVRTGVPTSTSESGTMDSVAVSCPNDGRDHTITVRGANDNGASIILSGGTPLGGYFPGGVGGGGITGGGTGGGVTGGGVTGGGVIGGGITGGGVIGGGLVGPAVVPVGGYIAPAIIPTENAADNTMLWAAGGVAVLVGGIVFAKYLSGRE